MISSNKKVSTSLQKIDDSKLRLSFDFLNPKNELSITLLHNGNIFVHGDLKNGNVDKVSNNDNYVPTSKNVYSIHNDEEEFSYSKFTGRMLDLLSTMTLLVITMFVIYEIIYTGNINNDHIVLLLFPMLFFIMLLRRR